MNTQTHSERKNGTKKHRWKWMVAIFTIVVAVHVLMRSHFEASRLNSFWGNEHREPPMQMKCGVVGTEDGTAAIGYLFNSAITLTDKFHFKFVTSQWPHVVRINGRRMKPLDKEMMLFFNNEEGKVMGVVLSQEDAISRFSKNTKWNDSDLRKAWHDCLIQWDREREPPSGGQQGNR